MSDKAFLIDSIVQQHTNYDINMFSGGSIQISTAYAGQIVNYKLLLFFGYSKNRHPITATIPIDKKDIGVLVQAIEDKIKSMQKNATSFVLDLDLECSREHRRDIAETSSKVVGKEVEVEVEDTYRPPKRTDLDEEINIIWKLHSDALSKIKTQSGNPRKNSSKTKVKAMYLNLRKKYSDAVMFCYVRNEGLRQSPNELLSLFGTKLDKEVLDLLSKQEDSLLREVLSNNNDKIFDNFYNKIMEIA